MGAIGIAQGEAEGAIASAKMPKQYFKKMAPNLFFSKKPARDVYSSHAGVRSAPPQEECQGRSQKFVFWGYKFFFLGGGV